MKKILIISQHKSQRGALKAAVEMEKVLKLNTNNKVIFFSEKYAVHSKVNFLKIKIFKNINRFIKPLFWGKNKITNSLPQIFKFFDHEKFNGDFVLVNHVNEFFSVRDIVLFRKPTIIFIHDMWFLGGIKHFFSKGSFKKDLKNKFYSFYGLLNFLAWKFKKNYLAKNKKIIFVTSSKWLKKQAHLSIISKDHRIEKINTPVDTFYWRKLNKNVSRNKLNLPVDKNLILFVAKGGLENYRKGGDIFKKIILTFRNQDKINFVILGHQKNSRDELLKNTFFINFRDDSSKLRNLYNAVDLSFCLSRHENIPYSVIETMSCGVPNISINTGGLGEVIKHKETGWLLKNTKISNIELAVKWSLSKNNYSRLSKNSINFVRKEFSYPKIRRDYEKLFKSI